MSSEDPGCETPVLQAGKTCWRLERARRAAVLIDGQAYFRAMRAALECARHSIFLLGWDFDPLVCLEPALDAQAAGEPFHGLLRRLLARQPDLRIHILIWKMALPFALQRRDRPQRAQRWLANHRLHYRLDGDHPVGAAHHQKILAIDDAIAFCGGSDFTRNRWDTPAHLPLDGRRRTRDGWIYGPRHDVVMAVDGTAAAALGDLARERWRRATGTQIQPPFAETDAWPSSLVPDATDVLVGVARTKPDWNGRPQVREVEALHLDAIAAAKRWIYVENEYVTSPAVGHALASRLAEPDGPEIVVVCPLHSGGPFDRLVMDHARNHLIHRLHQANRYGRFRVFAPIAHGDVPITVHSKLLIIDDRLLRVGSANLNNRSLGFYTECELAVEAARGDRRTRRVIENVLHRLVAEHVDSPTDHFAAELQKTGSLLASIESLNPKSGRRLLALIVDKPGLVDRIMGATHLFDPVDVRENWRPWRRIGLLHQPASAGGH